MKIYTKNLITDTNNLKQSCKKYEVDFLFITNEGFFRLYNDKYFKDLDNISTPQAVIFMTGVLTSFVGVLCLAKQIEASPESYSDHSQP